MIEERFTDLSKETQETITFVASAAVGGIIGNRADNWFVNLFYHQKKRIKECAGKLFLSDQERANIEDNENLKMLFSQITYSAANEIFDQKIMIWPSITESLLRNKSFEFDKKLYFINCFIKLDPITLHFLLTLYINQSILYSDVYPNDDHSWLGHETFNFYLADLQLSPYGFTSLSDNVTRIKITEFGMEFVDFISNSLLERVREFSNLKEES